MVSGQGPGYSVYRAAGGYLCSLVRLEIIGYHQEALICTQLVFDSGLLLPLCTERVFHNGERFFCPLGPSSWTV